MASTHAKAVRRADALQRLSDRLGIEQADLYRNARGDSEMGLIITLERIADAVEEKVSLPAKKAKKVDAIPDDAVGPLTVETVKEEPLKTTEIVEVVDDEAKGKTAKGGKDAS